MSNPRIGSEPAPASNPSSSSVPANVSNPSNTSDAVRLLSIMVRGAYDIQMLRMQTGLRLVGNFRAKLKRPSPASNPTKNSEPNSASNPESASDPPEIDAEGEKVLDMLRESYRSLMEGVARNRTLPSEKGFKGDEIISTFAELALVDQYMVLEREEGRQFRLLTTHLETIPIYVHYLRDQKGVGPAMAGVIIGWLDPRKARHVSSFWRFCGLDVGPDGAGRSRRAEHLVEREYIDKDGDTATRMGVTYDPFVKTKLVGVLAGSFVRLGSPWRQVYDDYKHRLQTTRTTCTIVEWKKRRKAGDDVSQLWPPKRIDNAAKRYMVKMFLAELWVTWRIMEGLPVSEPYGVAHQGQRRHGT